MAEITSEMLREVFRQTQREILAHDASDQIKSERHQARWERMAELLNEKIAHQQSSPEMQEITPSHQN